MAELRHGAPVNMSGWLLKEGFFKKKHRRYLRLRGSVLSSHHAETSPATWEINVTDSPIKSGSRQYELIIVTGDRKRSSYFAENAEDFIRWSESFKRASCLSVDDYYRIGPVLGQGAFAEVRLAQDRATSEKFAIKIIKKREYDAKEMEFVLREMSIMKAIRHPNIVGTFDLFDSRVTLHIVMEFMEGGELFDIIADAGHFSERKASEVARGILSGVAYLHDNSIVHRDMKPENILCRSKAWPLEVKLADFGLASFISDHEIEDESKKEITSMIGTPGYVAPEVVKREGYGQAVDLWATGVILYIMLSGKMPFFGKDDQECLKRIAIGKYAFPTKEWSSISEPAKNLVRSLLQVDPTKRLTAKAALAHNWMDSENVRDTKIENDFTGIHSTRRKFKKAVYAALTIQRMRDAMNSLTQANSSGTL